MADLRLYELDRPALKVLSGDIERVLRDDDVAGLAALLELSDQLAERLRSTERLVDWFLRAEDDAEAAPLYASLRRVSKKRALTPLLSDPETSLEGRLRGFEVLRDDKDIAAAIDNLLNPKRLPWYLRRPGATCGWLSGKSREQLAAALRPLRPSLTPELVRFAEAIDDADGDVVSHDGL